jgi:hypothetical protein
MAASASSTACALLNLGNNVRHSEAVEARQRCQPLVVAAASVAEALAAPSADESALHGTPTDSVPDCGRRLQIAALPRKEWTHEEDAQIRHGVKTLGCRWRAIAAQLPGRSDDAVRNRWSRLQDSSRDKSVADAADDAAAARARESTGDDSPRGRSGRRAREKGKSERSSWTRAEDDVIVTGVSELGHKWYEIARRLPGRTDHAIRNRWSRLQTISGIEERREGPDSAQAAASVSPATNSTSPSPPATLPTLPPTGSAQQREADAAATTRQARASALAAQGISDEQLLLGLSAAPSRLADIAPAAAAIAVSSGASPAVTGEAATEGAAAAEEVEALMLLRKRSRETCG